MFMCTANLIKIFVKLKRRLVTIVYQDGSRNSKVCSLSSEVNYLNCLVKSIKCIQNSLLDSPLLKSPPPLINIFKLKACCPVSNFSNVAY